MTMNLKYLTLAALLAAGAASAEHYKVITPLSKDDDGAMARLVNFDSGATVDSVLVADGVATFEGEGDEPYLARVVVDGCRSLYSNLAPFHSTTRKEPSAPCSTTS